jgi:hypothetical protein
MVSVPLAPRWRPDADRDRNVAVKLLLVVFSSAVIAGLAIYAVFTTCNAFEMMGARVTVHVDAFVAFIACLALAASAISIGLQRALVRSERNALRAMEQRIAQLEAQKKA